MLNVTPVDSISAQDQKITVDLEVEQVGNFLMWRVAKTFVMKSNEETIIINTRDDNIETEPGSIKLSLVDL